MFMKIVVTAGGTMGHINPALAIIDEFKKHDKNLEVIYFGTHNRMEKDIIPNLGYRYIPLEIYGFSKNIGRDIKNVFLVKKAISNVRCLLKEEKPDVVIGVGGYVTYPVILAAHKEHIKIFIHEQNSIPGKSNKMISKYADLIGVTFKESENHLKTKGKIILTGHPCGAWAKEVPEKNKKDFMMRPDKKLITIVAGSLGSGSLNEKMLSFLKSIGTQNYEVCYITGKGHFEEFKQNAFPSNVHILPYVEGLPGLLKISDVVISRAGAGSLSEIMALKKLAIIIPSPNVANNHQYYNAKELSDKGLIYLLEEKDLTSSSLEEAISKMLWDTAFKQKIKSKLDKEKTSESSKIIYEEIMKIVK